MRPSSSGAPPRLNRREGSSPRIVRRHRGAPRLAPRLLVGGAVLAQAGSSTRGQEGGILRVSFSPAAGLDYVDPALSFTQPGWSLLDATCARLFTYPDKESPAGFRLQPEVAASWKVSDDLKTYTFTLRRGFRFSDGEPVRANAFAHAINRVLQLGRALARRRSSCATSSGRRDVLSGQAKTARGVVARGNTLVVRFKRPRSGLHRPDDASRSSARSRPGCRPRAEGLGDVPVGRPLLRHRSTAERAHRHPAQPLLRRPAARSTSTAST